MKNNKSKLNTANSFGLPLLLTLLTGYSSISFAEVIASGTTNTQVGEVGGVPVVEIAAPSASGVSRNEFGQFDVGSVGVIINNSLEGGVPKLATGHVGANANFSGQSASIILNEVSGTGRSYLNGTTELLGDNANYILANPNGITCNGCGFIRTPTAQFDRGTTIQEVILGTGTANFSVAGEAPFELRINKSSQADIVIGPGGLDLDSVDATTLLTRRAVIDGIIDAADNSLRVLAGAGRLEVDATTPAMERIFNAENSGDGSVTVAIDASELGAMYAGQIYIAANESGVGVTLDNELVATTGDIEITADGDIRYRDASAAANVAVVAEGSAVTLKADGDTVAGGDISLSSEQGLSLSDIRDGVNTLQAGGQVTLACTGSACAASASDALEIQAGALNSAMDISSANGKDIVVDASISDAGTIAAGGDLRVNAGTGDVAADLLQAQGDVRLNSNKSGSVLGAEIQAGGDAVLNCQGGGGCSYQAASDLVINAGAVSGNAALGAAGSLSIAASNGDIALNQVSAVGDIQLQTELAGASVTAQDVTSSTGGIDWQLNQTGTLNSPLNAATTISIHCSGAAECGVQSPGSLTLNANDLALAAALSTLSGDLVLNSNVAASHDIRSAGSLQINAVDGDILLTGAVEAASAMGFDSAANGEVRLDGDVVAGGDIRFTGEGTYIHDDLGGFAIAGDWYFNLYGLSNSAELSDLLDNTLRVTQLDNSGLIQSGAALHLQVDEVLRNQGVIASLEGNVLIGHSDASQATTLVENSGHITAYELSQSQQPGDEIIIDTDDLIVEHTRRILAGEKRSAGDLLNDILAANAEVIAELSASSGVPGSVEINAVELRNHTSGVINASQVLLNAEQLYNQGGQIVAGDNISIEGEVLENTNGVELFGVITALNNVDISLGDRILNEGVIEGRDIVVDAPNQANLNAAGLISDSLDGRTLMTGALAEATAGLLAFELSADEQIHYQFNPADGSSVIDSDTSALTQQFLQTLGVDLAGGTPLIGDDIFMAELIGQAVREAGALPFVTGDRNSIRQLGSLYRNTLSFMQEHGVQFGESLSDSQRSELMAPVLTFSRQTLASGAVVYVPNLLLPQSSTAPDLAQIEMLTTQILARNDLLLQGETIENSASLLAGDNLSISAVDFVQIEDAERNWYVDEQGQVQYIGPKVAANNVAIVLEGDYIQSGGQVVADNQILISAENLIIGAPEKNTLTTAVKATSRKMLKRKGNRSLLSLLDKRGHKKFKRTGGVKTPDKGASAALVKNKKVRSKLLKSDAESSIEGAEVLLVSRKDMQLNKADIQASGEGGLTLLAETGDINTLNSHLSAQSQLALIATEGSISNRISSMSGNGVYMEAGKDINIISQLAVIDNPAVRQKSGKRSKTTQTVTQSQSVKVDVASIAAGEEGLVQVAGGNITSTGGELSSAGDISQSAGGNIVNKTLAKTYLKKSTHSTTKSSRGYGRTRSTSVSSSSSSETGVATQAATIEAGGNIVQQAGGKIQNIAGDIRAQKNIYQQAEGGIENKSLVLQTQSRSQSSQVSSGTRFGLSSGSKHYASNTTQTALIEGAISAGEDLVMAATRLDDGTDDDGPTDDGGEHHDQDRQPHKRNELKAKGADKAQYGEQVAVATAEGQQPAATGDVVNEGNLSAGGSIYISARNIENTRLKGQNSEYTRKAGKAVSKQYQTALNTGSITSGQDIALNADRDIRDTAGRYSAGNDLTLITGGDISQNALSLDSTIRSTKQSTVRSGRLFSRTRSYGSKTTATGAEVGSFDAGNNLTIAAQGDVTLTGSQLTAGQRVDIYGKDVTLAVARESVNKKTTYGRSYKTQNNVDHRAASISAGDNIAIQAADALTLVGTDLTTTENIFLSGKDVLIDAARNSTYSKKKSRRKKRINSSVTHDVAALNAGGNIVVNAEGDLTTKGTRMAAGVSELEEVQPGHIVLNAKGDTKLLGVNNEVYSYYKKTKKKSFGRKKTKIKEKKKVTLEETELLASGNVLVNIDWDEEGSLVGRDSGRVLLEGTKVNAGENALLYGGEALDVVSGVEYSFSRKETHRRGVGGLSSSGKVKKAKELRLGHANIDAAGNAALLSGGDVSIVASTIGANNINVDAGFGQPEEVEANVYVIGAHEVKSSLEQKYKQSFDLSSFTTASALLTGDMNWGEYESTKDWKSSKTYVGSQLTARNNIQVRANSDITIEGSAINAGNIIAMTAGKDINLLTGMTETASEHEHTEGTMGLEFEDGGRINFARYETERNLNAQTSSVGSSLSANHIQLSAGNDANIIGSSVMAAGDLVVDAGRDINVLAGVTETYSKQEEETLRVGIDFSSDSSSVEFFAGKQYERKGTEDTRVTAAGDFAGEADNYGLAGSVLAGNNVSLTAGEDVTLVGSDINTWAYPSDEEEETDSVEGNRNKPQDHDGDEEPTPNGNILIKAGGDINTLASANTSKLKTYEESLRAGLKIGAQENVSHAVDSVKAAKDDGGAGSTMRAIDALSGARDGAVSASAGVVAEWSRFESTDTSSSSRATQLNAANNLSMISGGDQTHKGTQAYAANNLNVDAGGQLTIESAQSTYKHEDKFLSASATIGLGENGGGISGSLSYANNRNKNVAHNNAHFTAGNVASISSSGDTTLAGAVVRGEHLKADIGGNLTIASLQDTGKTRGERGSLSVGTGNFSASAGNTEGDREWVSEQSGLYAADSVDIYVKEKTTLTGAVINSDTGNLKLDTQSLAFSDIKDKDKLTSIDIGVGVQRSATSASGGDDSNPMGPVDNASIGYQKTDRRQLNRATIGAGTIIVRDDAANGSDSTAGLNRDISKAQEITRDKESGVDFYVSNKSLETVTDRKAIQDFLNPYRTLGEIGSSAAQGVLSLDQAMYDGITLNGLDKKPNLDPSRGFLNAEAVTRVADKIESGTQALQNVIASKNHDGDWQFFGLGEGNDLATHFDQQVTARTDYRRARQAADAAKVGDGDSIDVTNNFTAHDAETNQAAADLLVDQLAGEDVNTLLYRDQKEAGIARNADGVAITPDGEQRIAGINISSTDASNEREYVSALGEESRHISSHKDGYANLYGDEIGYLWARDNRRENRATGGTVSMEAWREQNKDNVLLNENSVFIGRQRPSQMHFRALRVNEAIMLDTARQEILALPGVDENERAAALFQLDAMACAKVRCANSVNDDAPEYNGLKNLEKLGALYEEQLGRDLYGVLEELGIDYVLQKGTGQTRRGYRGDKRAFAYTGADWVDDKVGVAENVIDKGVAVAETFGNAMATVGMAGVTVTTAPACTTIAGCMAPVAGAAGTAYFYTETSESAEGIVAPAQYHQGEIVADSFTQSTHRGDRSNLGDAAGVVVIAAAEYGLGKIIGKKGSEQVVNRAAHAADDVNGSMRTSIDSAGSGGGAPGVSRKRAELKNTDTSEFSNAQKGDYGEQIDRLTLERAGYMELEARLPSNNGFDGVFVKYDADGGVADIIITESKFSSSGKASVSKTDMGRQMGAEWIDANIQKMMLDSNPAVQETGLFLDMYKSLIRTKGSITTPDGLNRWNKLNLPEAPSDFGG